MDEALLRWTLGWTMVHFLWVGAVVGGIAVWLRRRGHARPRYRTALSLLVMLGVAAPLAFAVVLPGEPAPPPATPVVAVAPPTLPVPVLAAGAAPGETRLPPDWLARMRSGLPAVWLAGTALCALWLVAGALATRRLLRGCAAVTAPRVVDAAARLARTTGLRRAVGLAASDRVRSPLVAGIRRPTVVLPAARLALWTDAELEMVLLHELTHVRRHDNLVNLGQRLLEALLFFHPVAWWLSRWVRHERERSCDATVVALTGRPRTYARTLLALATAPGPAPSLSTAMSHDPLVDRIATILDKENHSMGIPRSLSVSTLALTAASALLIGVRAQDPPPYPNAPVAVRSAPPRLPQAPAPAAQPLAPCCTEAPHAQLQPGSCLDCHQASVHQPDWHHASAGSSCAKCHGLAPAQAPRARSYTVRRGDSLQKIAKKLYGSSRYVRTLQDANPDLEPRRLAVGQKLLLPPAAQSAPAVDPHHDGLPRARPPAVTTNPFRVRPAAPTASAPLARPRFRRLPAPVADPLVAVAPPVSGLPSSPPAVPSLPQWRVPAAPAAPSLPGPDPRTGNPLRVATPVRLPPGSSVNHRLQQLEETVRTLQAEIERLRGRRKML